MNITSSCLFLAALLAQAHAETSLTIYNQNFGVVRDVVPLDLQQGVNQVRFADAVQAMQVDGAKPSSLIVVLTGAMSPRLRQELEARGFRVQDKLLKGPLN